MLGVLANVPDFDVIFTEPVESISFVSMGRDLAMREGDEVANGMGGALAVGG